MMELTPEERQLLMDVLDKQHRDLLQEIGHTDSLDYKAKLRERLDLLDRIRNKASYSATVH